MTNNVLFSSRQLSIALGVSEKTFYNKLLWAKKKKKFKKTNQGYCYTKKDALQLAKLLGLPIKL